MVQKINPHPAPGCNRSPPYYVFSKDAILGSVPSISSEVLVYCCDDKSYTCLVGIGLNASILFIMAKCTDYGHPMKA